MKKITSLLCIICAFVANTFAQTTFDVFTYKEPLGYTKQTKEGLVSYTKYNKTKTAFCQIGLYSAIQNNSNLTEAFNNSWQDLVVKKYNPTAQPQPTEAQSINGWKVMSGNAPYTADNIQQAALLYTFTKNNLAADIVVLTNSKEFETDITALINSLKLKANTTTTVNNSNTKPTNPSTNNNAEPELWFTYKLSGTKYMTMEPNFYLVYKNGDYKDEAPWQGLLSFNATQNKQEFPLGWGKFMMNNNGNGTFTINNYTEKVIKLSADKMDRPDASWDYMKCKSVNNLKLQASYSHQEGWSKNANFNTKTCKDLLTLNKDGSFVDNGFFLGSCDYQNPKDAPGSGTYQIQNFTIQLKYSDGRITERLLCGLGTANPFVENGSIFIGHQMVYNK